ncbi:MAG: DNA polymerase III subunit delta [Alphaproteobacteria bacterium]|nr:DNA polymerase III subunit delta [Alphaproteobacteria bacterium]
MKIPWKQIENFTKNPDPKARVILVYGADNGLMKERAKSIALSIVNDINDPFNAVTLSTDILQEDPARLNDEACAISMMGGDRLIRIKNATDKLTQLLKTYLENPNKSSLVILEAGELGTRSSLRKLCEAAKNAAALPCYIEDERNLSILIRKSIQSANLNIEQDAINWLAINISGDRQKVRSELEKIITYKGIETSPVSLNDVQACCGETGVQSLDNLIYSVAGNQPAKALKTYNQLLGDGVNFIVIVRALQNHFRRLHITKARMEQGTSTDIAMKSLMPPVFFKQQNEFRYQAKRWNIKSLNKIMSRLMELEAQCKQTGAPVETLCSQAILGISSIKR